MEAWEFIERAALALGVRPEAVRKWRVRGVPHSWRLRIVDTAAASNYPLDRGEFDRPPGPRRSPVSDAAPSEAA